MTYPRWLYVVRYGEWTKIGCTIGLADRMSTYRWQARRRDNVEWRLIAAVLPHPEAGANEQAIVTRFRVPGGPRTEYLCAPVDDVVAAMYELPRSDPGEEGRSRTYYERELARTLELSS